MPLPDVLYCAQQIDIPPELPDILKNFTKAAIRTQPRDLLVWSAAYFNALAKEECLPVKERLETKTDTGLTPGLLKILHQQLSPMQTCSREELQTKWKGLCLPGEQLETLLSLGSFGTEIDWMEFFALGCGALGTTLCGSLKFACEILTNDEEGGPARIPFDTFVKLYTYLACIDGDIPRDKVDNFLHDLQQKVNISWNIYSSGAVSPIVSEKLDRRENMKELQDGMIKPLDFIHRGDVDLFPEPPQELNSQKRGET